MQAINETAFIGDDQIILRDIDDLLDEPEKHDFEQPKTDGAPDKKQMNVNMVDPDLVKSQSFFCTEHYRIPKLDPLERRYK